MKAVRSGMRPYTTRLHGVFPERQCSLCKKLKLTESNILGLVARRSPHFVPTVYTLKVDGIHRCKPTNYHDVSLPYSVAGRVHFNAKLKIYSTTVLYRWFRKIRYDTKLVKFTIRAGIA
jgi:hypothetical protein